MSYDTTAKTEVKPMTPTTPDQYDQCACGNRKRKESSQCVSCGAKRPGEWEIDWSKRQSAQVWARKPNASLPSAKEWHWTAYATIVAAGIEWLPRDYGDGWEVDWTQRDGERVWARNPKSKAKTARPWHWVRQTTLETAGIVWQSQFQGRYVSGGYVIRTPLSMSEDQIALCDKYDLWSRREISDRSLAYGNGTGVGSVAEHRLVAAEVYGDITGMVIRHINGVKTDNRPENLVPGTSAENTMDHVTARTQAMYWRTLYEALRDGRMIPDLEFPSSESINE